MMHTSNQRLVSSPVRPVVAPAAMAGEIPISQSLSLARTLTQFSLALRPHQLTAFRGAVAEFAGYDVECFHNHDGSNGGYHYSYPLVQYHIHQGGAAITAVGKAVAALDKLLHRYDGHLWMGERWQRADVERIEHQTFAVGTNPTWQAYQISNWIPFNSQNYQAWRAKARQVERLEMLERTLVGQVLAFASSVGWTIEQHLAAEILQLSEPKWCLRHGQPALAFDAVFQLRALLPEHIGIGKGVSVGYGRLCRYKAHS